MSIFDGIIDNIDDVAVKLGVPAEQAEAVIANIKARLATGGDAFASISAAALEHGISIDRLKSVLPDGGDGLMAKAQSMLDKDGDGEVLDDLQDMAKGLFGKS